MTTGLCITCKHWFKYPDDEYGALRGAGECQTVKHINDVSDLRQDPVDLLLDYRVLKPEYAGLLAATEDGSGYKATFITMPAFGCVQHQAKPEA